MTVVRNHVQADLVREALAEWERLWDASGLADFVSVSFSDRLRVSLGRAVPAIGRVTLHAALRDGASERLREVLCHEVAHVAAARRAAARGHRRPRAHGAEWAALVVAAGYAPRASAAIAGLPHRSAPAGSEPPWVVHTCPVCHMQRLARRRVSAWRCAACVANGLPGELVVSRRRRGARGEHWRTGERA